MTQLKLTRIGDIKNTNDLRILTNSLDIVKKKGKEAWNPIDVLVLVSQGSVSFIIGENDIDCLTFYTKIDDYTKESILWIWTANAVGRNPFEVYLEELKTLATIINCTAIQWNSTRRGYIKRLPKLGADVSRVEYKIII